MASKIILDNIIVKNSSAMFTDPLTFEVTFTCLQPLSSSLSWKIIYVGSALTEDYDQELEEFEIPPIQSSSTLKFEIESQPPTALKIPRNELLCVTALLLTASYKNQEFIRVGYYVHNQLIEQTSELDLEAIESRPTQEIIKKIRRTIISDKPRVTRFNINWSQKPTKRRQEDSQSRLDDFFSIYSQSGSRQRKQEEEYSSFQQRINDKQFSTYAQSEQMQAK